jgi:nuclease S1
MEERGRSKLTHRMKHHHRSTRAIVLCAVLLVPGSAWPWGRLGHRVVAKMAEDQLTPQALATVYDLLGLGVSLADISTWADEQREIPRTGP